MLTKFDGVCDFCGEKTEAGRGDFQSIGSLGKEQKKLFTGFGFKGKWLVRCFRCKGIKHTKKYREHLEKLNGY